MCLFSYKKNLKINIFPKTVYKVVWIEGDKVLSYYQKFEFKFNTTYKIPQETILNNSRIGFSDSDKKMYIFYDGFHSYSKHTLGNLFYTSGTLVKCRIPAFSRIVYNFNNTEILSNKIKILKICQ